MAAITRWVEYDPASNGYVGDGNGAHHLGTRGVCIGTGSVDFSEGGITIGPTTNQLTVNIDGSSGDYTGSITLYSGANLDPRFIARDITEKIHRHGFVSKASNQRWINATCKWENAYDDDTGDTYGHAFKFYSGTQGFSSSVTVTGTAATILGLDTQVHPGGVATNNNNSSVEATVSGTYQGFFDETYRVVVTNDASTYSRGIASPVIKNPAAGGTNSYNGVMSTGGVYNYPTNCLYTIVITIPGSTMGGGTGNVPVMTWTSTGGFDDSGPNGTELLYVKHWYNVGTRGLRVKFTDAVFYAANPAWEIQCYAPTAAAAGNPDANIGEAEYVWASDRGDQSSTPIVTSSGSYTVLGSRGLSISFSGGAQLSAGDEFYVICAGPLPPTLQHYNITSLNYGNVTVSTESPVKTVMFEVESGAVEISTVKFGLESNGNFDHHILGDNDTFFRWGSVGPVYNAGVGDNNGIEWPTGITALNLSAGSNSLNAYDPNLEEVDNADQSKLVGALGLTADPVWLCIKLGSNETGANSSINHRLYFDYS